MRLNWKGVFLFLAIALGTVNCVSPFYGTARIEEGFHSYAGIAATSFIDSYGPSYYYANCIGARADISLQYGFCQYFQARGQIGGSLGWSLPKEGDYPDGYPGGVLHGNMDGIFELQGAYPFKSFTPAVALGITNILGDVSPTITALVGIGNLEIVTLGAKLPLDGITDLEPAWIDVMVGVHPHPRWSIFGGYRLFFHGYEVEFPIATLGIGYKLR